MQEKQTKLYILLIRSNSILSRLIYKVTKAEFTHASIGVSEDCRKLYSFARKYTYVPLPAGFVMEGIDHGLMGKSPKAPCALYEVSVSNEAYESINQHLNEMLKHSWKYRYRLSGLIQCYFKHEYDSTEHFFCSQFVAYILTLYGVIQPQKHVSLYQPVDFTCQPELKLRYKGTLGELMRENQSRGFRYQTNSYPSIS